MGKITEVIEQNLRKRLKLLLDLEKLETPEQLVGFDDASYRNITSWELFQQSVSVSRNRKQRYMEYDRMDENSDIKASLDAYAEEATVRNREKERAVWVTSDNQEIAELAHAMFDQVKLESQLYGLSRAVAKYGDDFEQVFYDSERGVYMIKYIEPNRIDRIVDDQNRLRGYKVDGARSLLNVNGQGNQALAQPWDFVHFKIDGCIRDGWGESILYGVQKNFRVLEQLETALALYRLARAADRNVFYVDIGTAGADSAFSIVEKWRQTYRKKKWFQSENGKDSGGGMVDFKYNPIDIIEDIFWPIRKDSQSRVEKLQGSNNVGDIADIEYWRNKVRYGLGIPPEYFGSSDSGGGAFDAKAGLIAQDMRFAKKCEKLQRAVITGVERLIHIHLRVLGLDSSDPKNEFKVHMESLSYLADMQRMEALMTRVTVAEGLVQTMQMLGMDPEAVAEYVFKKVLFTSDDELNDFFARNAELVADKMQQQTDMEQQQVQTDQQQQQAQTASLFAKAKQGITQAAKTPGGNSGVTVKPKKPSTKATREDELLPRPVTQLLEREDDFLKEFDEFLQSRKDAVQELKQEFSAIDDTIVRIENA